MNSFQYKAPFSLINSSLSQNYLLKCLAFVFLVAIFTYSSISLAVMVHVSDVKENKTYSFALPLKEQSTSAALLHKNLLGIKSKGLNQKKRTIDFYESTINIAGSKVHRSIPLIDSIPVLGADGVYHDDNKNKPFFYTHISLPKHSFKLNEAEALHVALSFQPKSLLKDPYVEIIKGMSEKVWLMHFDELRPAYKTRLPTLSIKDLKDIYVDASNGSILKIENSAQFATAPAHLFLYSPESTNLSLAKRKRVLLKDLINVKEGGHLKGKYIEVKNCCRYYTCPNEGECSDEKKRCALSSHPGAKQSREFIELPTRTLGLDHLFRPPEAITVDTIRCTYLPFAKASYGNSNNSTLGFYHQPIDGPGIKSEMDMFSEVQAYFSVTSFFNHIRTLLKDDTFCLRSHAMACNDDGSPMLDINGHPKKPYHVFVNQLTPDLKLEGPSQFGPDNLINQIISGKGTKDNPITIDKLTRMDNAAFIPALSTLNKKTPRADEILSDLIKDYDHNVFFQGHKDFAYDGDVVFHEFMHAVTTTMVGKLNTLGLSKWGINSEPGSLNEGWSDYFAATFNLDPIIGEYTAKKNVFGKTSLRNIENAATCPEDVIGEIHNDSQVWSGALWEIRNKLYKLGGDKFSNEFDREVLLSLALASKSENFQKQSQKLIENVANNSVLSKNANSIVKTVLENRGLTDCFRAFTLSQIDANDKIKFNNKDFLFIPSKNHIGLKNYAPSSSQLRVKIPTNANTLRLSFKKFLADTGAVIGGEITNENQGRITPLGVIAAFNEPINWSFKKAHAIAKTSSDDTLSVDNYAQYKNGKWSVSIPLNPDPCKRQTAFLSLLSHDYKYMLKDINVDFVMDNTVREIKCDSINAKVENEEAPLSCSFHKARFSYLIMLLLLFIVIALKRRLFLNHY